MTNTVVTAFSAKGYHEYGARMLESWAKYNNGHKLVVYTSDMDQCLPDVEQREQSDIPGFKEFLAKWDGNKAVAGREPIPGRWKQRELQVGYSYKWDSYKFFRMVAVMHHAAHAQGTGIMIWLDGDNVIREKSPHDLFTRWLPDDCAYAYLGREPKHSETGFVVFRLPDALPILDAWYAYYTYGTFLLEDEWHSAYLFDRAREQFPGIKGHNLTPGGSGHVIFQCSVGDWTMHNKGSRKSKGYSPEAFARAKRS